ncbi:phasin family protein [Bradyrhizobium sp. th.b2]|nr:TIGR01841 family phasin [Bradyrhizobium sp. th.b2]
MASKEKETMTEDTQSWLDRLRKFGGDLGLPKIDVDQLIDAHRKNLDALDRSAQVAAGGAKSLAGKQREILESALTEAAAMARDFKPTGDPQQIVAKQTEFAKKAFESAVQNTRDVAELATKTTTDATAIIRDRLRDSLSDLRAGLRRSDG